MKKQWIVSDLELNILVMALHADCREIEADTTTFTDQDKRKLINDRQELAARLAEIRDAIRKDWDDEGWVSRDQVVIRIAQKPGDEPYTIAPWGPDRWVVVAKEDPDRPVGEHIYTQKTHAHRAKRRLNSAARHMQAIMAET